MESLGSYAPLNLSCLKICQARLSDGAGMESHASDLMVILLVPKAGKTRLRLVPVICVTPDVPSGEISGFFLESLGWGWALEVESSTSNPPIPSFMYCFTRLNENLWAKIPEKGSLT